MHIWFELPILESHQFHWKIREIKTQLYRNINQNLNLNLPFYFTKKWISNSYLLNFFFISYYRHRSKLHISISHLWASVRLLSHIPFETLYFHLYKNIYHSLCTPAYPIQICKIKFFFANVELYFDYRSTAIKLRPHEKKINNIFKQF